MKCSIINSKRMRAFYLKREVDNDNYLLDLSTAMGTECLSCYAALFISHTMPQLFLSISIPNDTQSKSVISSMIFLYAGTARIHLT